MHDCVNQSRVVSSVLEISNNILAINKVRGVESPGLNWRL